MIPVRAEEPTDRPGKGFKYSVNKAPGPGYAMGRSPASDSAPTEGEVYSTESGSRLS